MDRLTNKVQKDLIEFRRIQDTLARYYEKAENREMAVNNSAKCNLVRFEKDGVYSAPVQPMF